jgi:hypothetical protein
VELDLAPPVKSLPPSPPFGGDVLRVMWWSLQLRFWAWRADTYQGAAPHIQLFLLYFDPNTHERLDHSLGLEKGMLGVVSVFADRRMAATNNFVITHELLHTVGATDKYDPNSNQPIFPDGYAEVERTPRYPQQFAEIMAGRIPISAARAEIPHSLNSALVGEKTAREINWVK